VTLGADLVTLRPGLPLDAGIAKVADAQHGAISLAQLGACGLGDSAVRGRVAAGRLHRLHRGVYAPGHLRLPRWGAIAAAVLACGPGAVASHLTAASLHALRRDGRSVIDVTVASRTGRRHGRVVTHTAATVRPQDITVIDGIPVTSVARTLLDCAPLVGCRGTEKLCQEAELRRVIDGSAIQRVLAHVPGHPGAGTLVAALDDLAQAHGITATGLEDLFLAAFRKAGLPEPECNAPIRRPDGSWAYADFLWADARLIVEADSRTYHNHVRAYRSDRRRDRALRRIGYETMRFSDEDAQDVAACAAEVADFLAVHHAASPA
jgi:hypothetical protein